MLIVLVGLGYTYIYICIHIYIYSLPQQHFKRPRNFQQLLRSRILYKPPSAMSRIEACPSNLFRSMAITSSRVSQASGLLHTR